MESSRDRDVEQASVVAAPEAAQATAGPALGGLVAGEPMAAAGSLTPAKVAALQRHAGNAAVSRLLGAGGRPPVRSSASQVVGRASILDDLAAPATAGQTPDTASTGGPSLDSSGAGASAGPAAESIAGTAPAAGAAPVGGSSSAGAAGGPVAFSGAGGAGAGLVAGLDLGAAGGGADAAPVADIVSAASDGDAKNGAAPAGGGPAAGNSAAAAVEDGKTSGEGAAKDLSSAAASGSAAQAAGTTGAASALVAGPQADKGAGEAKGAAAAGGEAKGAAAGGEAKGAAAGGGAKGAAAGGGPAATVAAASGAAAAPAEAPKINKDPHADPAFQAMKGRSKGAAGGAKAHTPAKAGAANAQGAAAPPSNDASSQAQAAQVSEMSTKQPGTFDREAFIAAVKQAIEAQAPKNLEEADDFKEGGAAGVKTQISGHVKKGKEGSEKDIKDATNAPPDASKAKPKPVEPMVNDQVGAGEKTVGAQGAMPPPTPAAHTDLSAGPDSIDAKMADAEVTEEQLKKSNEPSFNEALGAKDQAKEHSAAAPQDFRKDEKGVLAKAKGDAAALEGTGLTQMHGARGQALNQAVGHKQGAKTADEAKRAKVANDIQGIYDRTKADVTKTLDGLDGKVDAAFTQGEGQARKRFEDHVGQRMDAYKEDRYSGLLGKGRWLKDKLLGMPSEVNAFYAEGKTKYLADMDGVIGKIADIVGAGLTAARARIAQGKAEIVKYVAQLPQDLKKVGQEAEEKLQGQFEQLEADVEAKQSEMVDTLARKYVESRDALDARIDEMKAANKGLVDKAMDAISGVIKTIIQLKNMLMGVLAKAAGVIGDIIADPIGFLGNLIGGIKAGLSQFVGNIANHLQQGLMGWLTGALGNAGIELPKSFDIKSIFTLVLQVLGLTYANIRSRVAKQVGEPVVQKLEQTVEIFKVLITEGVGGLWRFVQDRLSDLYDTVVGGIKDFIIEKVIKAGITWLLAFMNPAAAFIKACKAIYDIIMFLIERGSEIMAFVNSVLDSIAAVAKGNIGAMASKIEESLAKALPLLISFLASLLGLGGISDKIRSLIQKVQAPINKAIDFVVQGAVKGAKKLFGKPAKWVKDKVQKGKDWAKDKYESAKDRVTGGGAKPKDKATDEAENGDREARLKAATDEAEALMHVEGATVGTVRAQLPAIKDRHKLTDLTLDKQDEYSYRPKAVINPIMRGDLGVLFTPEQLAEMRKTAQGWAKQIKEKGDRDVFLANPRRYIVGDPVKKKSPKVQVGDAVEAAAHPELALIADEAGLTLVRGLHLQAMGASGPVGGKQAEMDFVMLGSDSVVEVVSAKIDPGAYRFGTDRKALGHFVNAPLGGQDLIDYLTANFGKTPVWQKATSLDAVHTAGRSPLGDFRSRYLDKTPVTSVKVSGVSPAPEEPLNRQLRSTAPELIDEMIKMVTALL